MSISISTTARAGVLAAAAAAVSLLTAVGAQAQKPDADAQFLARISSLNIAYSSPEKAIAAGHQVCREIAEGEDPAQIEQDILSHTDLTRRQVDGFIIAAVDSYGEPQNKTLSA
jgi:hypothetical protein